jgi:acyl-CoA synthetase (AMP-forming)/AMP-acid ligase II
MTDSGPGLFRDTVTAPERKRRYEREDLWDATTLAGQVVKYADADPGEVAVVDGAGSHTRAALRDDAATAATWMADCGVGPGRVVSIQLPNRYELVVAAVAAQSLGAVVNPLLPNYRVRELENVFATARPDVIFTPGTYRGCDHQDLVAEVAARTGIRPRQVVIGDQPKPGNFAMPELTAGSVPATPLLPGAATAVSEVIFTSGTEARPKAIMHTEQTANFSVRVARADLGVEPTDVVWMPSPLGHSTGFNYGMRFALYHGLRLVLQDQWDADAAVDLIAREGCSYTLAATTFLRDLAAAAARRKADLATMRIFGCGGAPVPPALVGEAEKVGIGVLRLYGSTEVLVGTWNRPDSSEDHRRHTDGRPMSHVEIKVCDEDRRPVSPGQPGELYVRGPNTCVGFFEDPDRTAATFLDGGWVRSGDLVTVDRDGYLTVVGRRKEILIRGGLNIAPREIEELLVGFDEVEQAAVIGLPDDRLGERMCACVVLSPGCQLDLETAVERLRRAGLATFKLPERLVIRESLPMTASGKVQKHVLVSDLTGSGGD